MGELLGTIEEAVGIRRPVVAACANVANYLLFGKDQGHPALEMIQKSYTYGDIEKAVSAVARHLIRAGLRKGDRAILIGDNSLFWVSSYLGILRAGGVCVPLPADIPRADLGYILASTSPRFGFLRPALAAKHRDSLTAVAVTTDVPQEDAGEFRKPEDAGGNDLAALMFTSGSTGAPRGVMVTHANIIANTEGIVGSLGLTASDRIMAVLPFHYCFGTSLLHTHFRVGGTLVIDSRFMYPEEILQRMQRAECTGFAGVPSHYQILLRKSTLREKEFPHLRYVQQAGGHLAPAFVRELREALPKTKIYVMYGQTEATARLSYLPPEFLESKAGSIGRGMPGVVLKVLDDEGNKVRHGEVGEIVAEGLNVALGYWNEPEESAISFRDGKLYTGDLGTLDEDGFIFVVDRARDFLKCAGKRISCRQLEERLLEFEELLEAAVVGVPDPILGEAVKAFVVPRRKDATGIQERVLEFAKTRFPTHLIPGEVVALGQLPKNSSGKVIKHALKSGMPISA